MKVYVAFRGEYSDRRCVGVFSTREIALKAAEDQDVEEQELRDDPAYAQPCGQNYYEFALSLKTGDILEQRVRSGLSQCDLDHGNFDACVLSALRAEGRNPEYDHMGCASILPWLSGWYGAGALKQKLMADADHVACYVSCLARSEEHAIKIASEQRIKFITKQQVEIDAITRWREAGDVNAPILPEHAEAPSAQPLGHIDFPPGPMGLTGATGPKG